MSINLFILANDFAAKGYLIKINKKIKCNYSKAGI